MSMQKILFRADAKPGIGTGDLVSLIHLSRVFEKNGWETHFFIRDSDMGKRLIRDRSIRNYREFPDSESVEEEVDDINRYLSKNNITHFFACVTERLLTLYTNIHSDVIKGCINFDGIIPEDYKLTVNWNFPDPEWYKQKEHPKTQFLLGPEYVVLPDNFDQDVIHAREFNRPIKNLLVSMGGADEHDLTLQAVQKIIAESLELNLNIILGAGYRNHEPLEKFLSASGLNYICKSSVTDMFKEYMECDAAIATGGLTSSELVATHTPALLIAAYPHQEARCRFFHDNQMATYLGPQEQLVDKKLGTALAKLEQFSSKNFTMNFRGAEVIFTHFSQLA